MIRHKHISRLPMQSERFQARSNSIRAWFKALAYLGLAALAAYLIYLWLFTSWVIRDGEGRIVHIHL